MADSLTINRPARWLRYLGFAASLWLAWESFRDTSSTVLAKSRPDLALRLVADHPAATVRLGEISVAEEGAGRNALDPHATALRLSLDKAPLNAATMRLLAIHADNRNQSNEAQRLFALSSRVSRRDIGTQLWIIDEAVKANDLRRALIAYDTTLRVHSSAGPLLYRQLAFALTDPVVRLAFVPYINQDVPWLDTFFAFSIQQQLAPAALADAVADAGGFPAREVFRDIERQLVSLLAERGDHLQLRRLVPNIRMVDPKLLNSTEFRIYAGRRELPPISWQLMDQPGISAAFQPSGDNAARTELIIAAGGEERGLVARKMVLLKPGQYRLSSRIRWLSSSPDAQLTISVACSVAAQSAPRLAAVALPDSPQLHGNFAVTPDCPAQYLFITAAGGRSQLGSELIVSDLTVQSAN